MATTVSPAAAAGITPRVRGWLGWFALAVIVGMQAGTVFKPLGTVEALTLMASSVTIRIRKGSTA